MTSIYALHTKKQRK